MNLNVIVQNEPLRETNGAKRKWTPVKPVAGQCKEGAEEAIHRALALRHMELPVGDFITNALSNEVPEVARDLLLSNVTDEENHDVALGYIADAYGVDEKAEAEGTQTQRCLGGASGSYGPQSNGCRACDFLRSPPIL